MSRFLLLWLTKAVTLKHKTDPNIRYHIISIKQNNNILYDEFKDFKNWNMTYILIAWSTFYIFLSYFQWRGKKFHASEYILLVKGHWNHT